MSDEEGIRRATNVKTWLIEAGFFEREDELKETFSAFRCKLGELPLGVVLPLRGNIVWLETGIDLGQKQEKQLNALIEQDATFLWNLHLASVYIGCGMKLIGREGRDYETDSHLTTIRLRSNVHYDGLSKETLMKAIERLDRMIQAIKLTFQMHNIEPNVRGSSIYR